MAAPDPIAAKSGRRRALRLPLAPARAALGAAARPVLLGAALLAALAASAAGAQSTAPSPSPSSTTDAGTPSLAALSSGDAIDIRATLGFSGVFRLDTWAPLTLTLENRRADLRGQIEVRVPDGDVLGGQAFANVHRRPLDLPAGSRKRFHFTVYLKSFSRPLEVRVLAGSEVRARAEIDLRSGVTNARIVLVLGRDADLDYLNDAAGRRLRVLYPRRERLPEHWAGYEGVAALVTQGVSLEGLSARQYAALTKWLARGGILAVSGGVDYGVLRTPRLSTLLPGPPLGLERVEDGTGVGVALGTPLAAPRPFHVNRVPHFEGRALYRSGRTPLVLERAFGRGRVLYLTFDVSRYPFDGWPGMTRLWHALFDLPPLESLSAQLSGEDTASALPGLIQASPLSFPGHPVVFVFVVLYLGCVALAFRLRPGGERFRRGLAGLRFAVPALFAPGAFFLFGPLLFPPGPVAVVAALVSPHAQGPFADLDLEVGLFASDDTPLRLEYRAPEPVFRPTEHGVESRSASDWRHRDAARGGSVEPAERGRYLLHTLEGRDVIAWDLQAAVREEREAFRLRIRNRSGRSLHGVWLVLDGGAYPLAALPLEADAEHVLVPERDARPLRERSWRRLLADASDAAAGTRGEAQADLIARELARRRANGAWRRDEAMLLGFSSSPLRLAGPSASWRRREVTLVMLRVPVERRARDAGGFRP